ncbi:MAG: lipocalin-like domain-containing protein [Bdellovibrionales bacterium]|nr:lipocalin-like domain-containing protein [Bdellovibrionales bacterium]
MEQEIIGTWQLEAFVIEDAETSRRRDWGKAAHGLLIYAPSGHMSVSINKQIESDPEQSEAENLFDSILFYSGTYQVAGKTITHQVTQASNPTRIGKEMIRYAEFHEGLLELVTPKEAFGRAILKWRKIA